MPVFEIAGLQSDRGGRDPQDDGGRENAMQSGGREDISGSVCNRLWSLGRRRGVYEAFRYPDPSKPDRRERRSLSTTSEQEAIDLVRQLNDELVAGGPMTINSCFALYRFHKQEKNKWTESMQRAMDRICAEIGTLAPRQVSIPICEAVIEKRLGLGLAKDTVRIEMSYLRAAVRNAEKRKWIDRAPFIVVPEGGEARERWLNHDEVSRLIAGAVEIHVKLFIILSVTTAARPSHILALTWPQIDLEHNIVDFRDRGQAENNKKRPRVPINATARAHLEVAKQLARTQHVVEFRGEGALKSIKKGVYRAAERAGLAGVSPYVLRHTAGVWMAKAGVPMQEIAAYMGHKNLATTMKHYAHFHPQFLRGAAQALEITAQTDPK